MHLEVNLCLAFSKLLNLECAVLRGGVMFIRPFRKTYIAAKYSYKSLLIFCLLGLMGCDPFSQPESAMDEYVVRLARVLDVDAHLSTPADVVRYPPRRSRVLDVPMIDINFLEFLSLHRCDLQVLVGERNAILGRVMQPITRLRYELRFIEAAQRCIESREDEATILLLTETIQLKQKALALHLWNATWGSDEMAQMLRQSAGFYPVEGGTGLVEQLSIDLQQLTSWTQRLADVSYTELASLSDIQQRWQYGHRGGQLLNSARLISTRLDDASALLDRRIEGKPLCPQGRPTPAARTLQSLFLNVYIVTIQPYLSDVDRSGQLLFDALTLLAESQKQVMPNAFKPFYQSTLVNASDSIWYQFDRSVQHHTEAWQILLEQCGMRPQA